MAYIVPNKIQPREYSMGSGMDGASYGTDSDDDLKVFNIEHDDNGQWLNSNNGHPNTLYNPDNQFVCVLPRNYPRFSPPAAESFCSCFNQPPSCLPSSSSCLEIIAY